jgi:hypothetical protein
VNALLAAFVGALVLLGVGIAAYHHGRRRGRVTLPADLVAELRQHKLQCIGEPAERVALEIGLLCETDRTVRR